MLVWIVLPSFFLKNIWWRLFFLHSLWCTMAYNFAHDIYSFKTCHCKLMNPFLLMEIADVLFKYTILILWRSRAIKRRIKFFYKRKEFTQRSQCQWIDCNDFEFMKFTNTVAIWIIKSIWEYICMHLYSDWKINIFLNVGEIFLDFINFSLFFFFSNFQGQVK